MAFVRLRNVGHMVFEFKRSKNLDLVNKIRLNVADIQDRSSKIQEQLNTVAHLVMVNDWYIQENMLCIEEDSEGATREHLEEVNTFFEDYGKQLTEVNKLLDSIVEIIANNFDYDDESIQDTIKRVGDYQ